MEHLAVGAARTVGNGAKVMSGLCLGISRSHGISVAFRLHQTVVTTHSHSQGEAVCSRTVSQGQKGGCI